MSNVSVRIGFVPSFRFSYTPWCQKMREDSLTTFSEVNGMEVIVPQPSPDGKSLDPEKGYTPNGTVSNLDQAEVVAEYFQRQKVDALILCPLDFGDERSAVKVAEKLHVPVLLYATKEPPAFDDSGLSRASDSYCGNLSMASGLYRRKIPFHYAGIFFPDEPEFKDEVQDFIRAVAVVKGLNGARIGQVGVRPSPFETVGYDETAMIRSFGQNVIHIELGDIVANAESYSDDDSQVQAIISDIKNSYAKITVSDNYLVKSAKMELSLTQFWNRNKLSGMAMQCWSSIQRSMGIIWSPDTKRYADCM
jgi:L-fucose isomerase-like protein